MTLICHQFFSDAYLCNGLELFEILSVKCVFIFFFSLNLFVAC